MTDHDSAFNLECVEQLHGILRQRSYLSATLLVVGNKRRGAKAA
jgi:hypothetical protein